MRIGVPREVKPDEYRVAFLPVGVEELVHDGHQVLVEAGAGLGSGLTDEEYKSSGATIVPDAKSVWHDSELIVKVKEPQVSEFALLNSNQILFTYFHFAASRPLTDAVMASGVTAIAYETIRDNRGSLPLLTPMSEVAGRMSIQKGANFLERPEDGRGILLSGVPGVAPAEVVVLGGGIVGANAARVAAGLGANVSILDVNLDRLRYLDDIMPPNVTTLFSDRHMIRDRLIHADLVIGSVLIPGAKAPHLVRFDDLKRMKNGSVIVDVAIDQGGCVETSRPTTHANPTFIVDGVVHYCVTNMPGAVGRTSTFALCNVTLPFIRRIAHVGWLAFAQSDQGFSLGLNIVSGKITNEAVARAFDLPYHSWAGLK